MSAYQLAMDRNLDEPMQADETHPENGKLYDVKNPTLDLEEYAQLYRGLGRLRRLINVSETCPKLRLESLKMAIFFVKDTYNIYLYQVLHQKLNSTRADVADDADDAAAGDFVAAAQPGGGNSRPVDWPIFDWTWMKSTAASASIELRELDSELIHSRLYPMTSNIWSAYKKLGDYYLNCGNLSKALECYLHALDHCTNRVYIFICVDVLRVYIFQENWSKVREYVSKVEKTPIELETRTVFVVPSCAAGIVELQSGQYKCAAEQFLRAPFDDYDLSDMFSPNDIAIYGILCALATFDREELRTHVTASESFEPFLGVDPKLREIVCAFQKSKFKSCLKMLDELRDNLMLDKYIAPHVESLYKKIRHRAMAEYLRPFSSVDIIIMAVVFGCKPMVLEAELKDLILDGQIKARIDGEDLMLYAFKEDERNLALKNAFAAGKQFQECARMAILRAAFKKANICVEPEE